MACFPTFVANLAPRFMACFARGFAIFNPTFAAFAPTFNPTFAIPIPTLSKAPIGSPIPTLDREKNPTKAISNPKDIVIYSIYARVKCS